MSVRCLLGQHDYRPVPDGARLVGICTGCGKESAGWIVGGTTLRYVKPRNRYRWQAYWYQRLGIQRRKIYDTPLRVARR